MISNTELGKMKLEYIIKKGIFLAPPTSWRGRIWTSIR